MFSPQQLQQFAQWSGYLTLFFAVLMLLGLVFKWGIRFRLVGVTGFMGVLTGGLFALSLGIYTRPEVPGATRFVRVFDTGASQVVISVAPDITIDQLDATLRQAAADLYSPGRLGDSNGKLTIRARTVLHPKPGISQPLYLGQIQRSLAGRSDEQMTVKLFEDNLAQRPQPTA